MQRLTESINLWLLLLIGGYMLVALLPLNNVGSALKNNYTLGLRWDYAIHTIFHIPLPFLLNQSIKNQNKFSKLYVMLIGLTIAMITEIMQYYISYRSFNINDLVANCIGVLLGGTLLVWKK